MTSATEIRKSEISIVISTLLRSDMPYSSTALCLAKELSRFNRVFYIDHPFTWRDYFSDRDNPMIQSRTPVWKKKEPILKTYSDSFPNLNIAAAPRMIPVNFLPAGNPFYSFLSSRNDRTFARFTNQLLSDSGIGKYLFFNIYDPFYGLKSHFNPEPLLSIYQTVDDITQEPYTAKHGYRLELEHMKKSDLVLATSTELVRIRSAETGKNVKLLANAADFDLFHTAATQTFDRPKELEGIDSKVMIYTGNLGTRVDYDLMRAVADRHKDKVLLLVGPLDGQNFTAHDLLKRENVIHTGPKNINELPGYLQHSDCALIPFEKSKLTKSIYPLKINEYLAAGLPVVTTAFSDLSDFTDFAYLAENYDEFNVYIDKALDQDCVSLKEKRYFTAGKNTWKDRVDRFWTYIEQTFESKNIKLNPN